WVTWASAPDATLHPSRLVMALRRWPSTAEYPGLLLLEFGLGQQASVHQLPELGEGGEPLGGLGGVRLVPGRRVVRWRWLLRWRRMGWPRRGLLVLRGPPRLLSPLHAAVHRASDGHGGGGFQQTHDCLLALLGRFGRVQGGDKLIGRQPAVGDQP